MGSSNSRVGDHFLGKSTSAAIFGGMDEEGRDLFNQLTVLHGAAFDRAYVRDQIQGHEQAVELLEGYSKRGDNDALKQLASTLLPTIKEHLQRAETLGSSVTARR